MLVSGKVMRGDGSPIPYTEVSVQEKFEDPNDPFGATFSVNTMRTLTDAEGNYQLDFVAMEREPFTVQASDPETGQSGSARSRVIMDGQHLRLDILLLGLGTLTGTVVKAEDQSPVQGAVVRASSLSSGGSFSTVSGSDGRFVIRMVTVGTLGVSAEAGLYSGSVSAQIPSAGATADVTVPVYSKGMGTGSVAGRVYEADGKTPVAGVPVTITGSHGYGNWKYSDTGGNYLFEAVPPGTFALRTFRQETGEQASANSAVSAGATTTVNLVLPGTAIIIGTVYDSNGLPVEGAEVLSGVTLVTTDRNGNFRIEKVPIGQVAVTAAIPGARDVISVTVGVGTPGEVVRVVIALQADSSISAKGVIQGYVKDPHGQPVRYQTVYIWDGETTPDVVSTDADGFFRNEMPLGSYSVRIVNDDLTDGDMKGKSLSLNSQIVTLELQFKGLGRITGTVFQPDGVTPTVANVLVTKTYFTAIGTPYTRTERYVSDQPTSSGVNGKFVIDKVRVGDFRLEASNAFYSQPAVRLGKISNPGETVIADIVLKTTASVRGQVYLANGDRAGAGLPVTFTPSARSSATLQILTREDGTFEFTLLPPEPFTLSVYDPLTGNFGVARGSVETGDSAVVDIYILGKGTVRVKVLDGAGNSVPGARVNLSSGSPVAYLVGEFPRIEAG